MHSLSRWLLTPVPPGALSLRESGEISLDAFLGDVAALVGAIEERDAGESEPRRWLLCAESSYACAVGLFGIWQSGSIAVLPPNFEAGSLRELSRGVRGIVSDRLVESCDLQLVPVLGRAHTARTGWRELDAGETALELCTSGSTGARKLVPKSLRQLEAEIEELETCFGSDCGAACVVGTVSHQHIYGLLFRVLWPLCAGRLFVDQAIAEPDAIALKLKSLGTALLVSSPAHLKRLPELIDLARLSPYCRQIFSSGGPIDDTTAQRYERELGWAPIEVLGSTETGGIAWRRQGIAAQSHVWTPFKSVRVEARDGLLCVRSLQAGSQDGITTGDHIEMHEDRFVLLGRSDRIVKVFEERVSLAELEVRLCAHPWVCEAAALMIERNATPRMAAAIVLTVEGARALAEQQRPGLIAALQAHLREYLRPTAVPRSWRFVASLPSDALGKTTLEALQFLFTSPPSRSPAQPASRRDLSTAARLLSRGVESERELEVELLVPDDLWCLPGHFEDFPVVPGVVQLQWVLDWAASWIGREPKLREIEALKFKRILTHGTRFRLRLEYALEQERIRFRLWDERGEFSTGRLILDPGPS